MLRHFISSKYMLDVILILVLIYFGYNTVIGNRGLLNYLALRSKLTESVSELNTWKAQREALDIKIKLLDINNIDIDFFSSNYIKDK